MKALIPVLTRAGMRAVFNASRDGVQAKVSHIAFGDRAYQPSGQETKLQNERVRVPIAGGKWVGDFTIHMTALLDTGPSFWIRECGIVLDNGTLLAVWSDPDTPLAYRTDGVPLMTAFDLTLEALPKSAVTVEAGDIDLTLFFGEEFARIGAAVIGNGERLAALRERLDAAERALSQAATRDERLARIEAAVAAIETRLDETLGIASLIGAIAATNHRLIRKG